MRHLLSFFLLSPLLLMSLPKDMQVRQGQINTENKLQELIIRQGTENGIINWKEFSIGEKEKVLFTLPNGDSKTFNRVIGENLSEINGKLSSNGTIYLINQNGILIGPNGSIQTKGFVGSTLDLSNEDFLIKAQKFYGQSEASIENNGLIETDGNICLFAKELINQGLINSKKGNVYLLSSNELIYQPHAREEIYYQIPINDPEEESIGKLVNKGIIEANTLQEENGRVYLIASTGDAEVHGNIQAEEVRVLGKKALVYETSNIDTSKEGKGGTVLIGGDYKGQNPEVQNANLTWVAGGATIRADGTNGDGGKIICWSDYATYMYGSLSAKSKEKGDGGFIEISSPYTLSYSGDVNASSINGKAGTVLFDPSDITVSVGVSSPAFTPPTYNPAVVASANLNTTDLQNALATQNVTISTSLGAGGAGDVTFQNDVTWASAFTLNVNAARSVIVNPGVTLSSTSASSGFTAFDFTSNSGGATSGTFNGMFLNNCTASSVGGDINVSSQGGDTSNNNFGIRLDGGTITTSGAGNIDLTGIGGGVVGGRGITMINTSAITATGSGDVTITGSSIGSSTGCDGVTLNSSTIATQNGTLIIDGRFGGTSGSGIELFTNASFTTTTGNMFMTGIGDAVIMFGLDMTAASASITSTSGNISITTDTILMPGTISSSGNLIIQPFTASTTIGLGVGAVGTLNLDSTELGNLTDGFSSITFGRADGTGAIDMTAFTYLDPIIVQGESITTSGAIAAGTNDVTFNIGVASAGTLNLDSTVITTGTFSINGGANNDVFNINVAGQIATFDGSGGTNTLSGPNAVNTWTVTANDTGELGSITFTNIQNLIGGTNDDAFTFNGAFQITGSINGAAGINTVVGPNIVTDWTITANNTGTINPTGASGATTFSNIQNLNGGSNNDNFTFSGAFQMSSLIDGGAGTNTITGSNVNNAWAVTSNNAGTINPTGASGATAFSNIQNLTGGTNNDTFTFSDGVSISGTVDGTSATGNEIDLSAYTTNVSINLQTSAATGTGGFSNIQSFIGGSGGSNTFTGANVVNAWTITADDTGTVGSIAFDTFENLEGGTNNDTFTFNGAFQISGSIDGIAGTNTIIGPDLATDWQVTSTDGGTLDPGVGTTLFTNIQNLTGGSPTDDFAFADGQGLTGAINGVAPAATNTFDYTAFTTTATINLITSTSGTASNLGEGFTNIANFIGNVNVIGPPAPPSPATVVDLVKFNSLDTELFLTLNEVRHFSLIEEFAWLQFNDPILGVLDKEIPEPLILDSKNNALFY